MALSALRAGFAVCALAVMAVAAQAQVPAGWADPVACACLQRALDSTRADMDAKIAEMNAARADLDHIDQQMAAARTTLNVNDPQAVAQFRELVLKHDAAFRRATGEVVSAAQKATARYNAVTADYNSQCAGRPLPPPPPGPLNCPAR